MVELPIYAIYTSSFFLFFQFFSAHSAIVSMSNSVFILEPHSDITNNCMRLPILRPFSTPSENYYF